MDSLKIYLHYIIHILLAAAIVLLLLIKPCATVMYEQPPQPDTVAVHDTIVKDTIIYVKAFIPVPEVREVTVIDTVYRDSLIFIDTSSYIARYYQDSINQDYGTVVWYAATTGELLALDAEYHGKVQTAIEYREREVKVHKGQLLFTSGIGYNGDQPAAEVGLEWITKRGKKYGVEYDFVNGFYKFKTGLRLF